MIQKYVSDIPESFNVKVLTTVPLETVLQRE